MRRAISWIFLTACGLGVVGVVLYFAFVFIVGPREDPTGRCAFYATEHVSPEQISSDQVRLTWSENLLTNTLRCTWGSVDGEKSTTVELSAY
ncbi:hypothetical protein [Flexivirga sp. B27]